MNTLIILGIICILIGGALMGYNGKGSAFFIYLFAYLGSGFLLAGIHADEPTAIDVYRGNTTLEITYKDSVAVDSVVVFKEKK